MGWIDPAEYRDLVSGRRRGLSASLLRAVLRAAEVPYSAAMRLRNWRYDTGRAAVTHVDVPVVCVGNLTVGGTGKTPMVEWVARWYRQQAVRVALVSRGYKAAEGSRNDEAIELELRLPDVPHVQNPDRVAAARLAIEEFESELILLDDGFQHRRLARDLDIVLVDALDPVGGGHLLPRGLLREPLSELRRAGVVGLSRADMVDEPERRRIESLVRRYAPDADWLELAHRPERLLNASGGETPIETFREQPVAAFCGIGNPAGFRHTLAAAGYRVADFREFPDHHAYSREDIDDLARWAASLDVEAVVCTHKDLVKIGIDELRGRRLWAVAIEMEILAGTEGLERRLSQLLPGR